MSVRESYPEQLLVMVQPVFLCDMRMGISLAKIAGKKANVKAVVITKPLLDRAILASGGDRRNLRL